jgi:periplasmic divalent cation tolerance protein
MADALEVHITAPDRDQAVALARVLVEERLAACVNIVGAVRSIYRWEGRIDEDDEVLCLVKTRRELFAALTARVHALHPYEVPQILAFEIVDGSPAYLAWLDEATRPA